MFTTRKRREIPPELPAIIQTALGSKASSSEARQLVGKARALFETAEFPNRDDLLLAEQLCQRAATLDPADGEVWAASAQVSSLIYYYPQIRSPARIEAAVSQARRG